MNIKYLSLALLLCITSSHHFALGRKKPLKTPDPSKQLWDLTLEDDKEKTAAGHSKHYITEIDNLLKRGAHPTAQYSIKRDGSESTTRSSLGSALLKGDKTIFKILLKGHEEYIDKDAVFNQTPLVYACKNQQQNNVDFLLQNKADANKEAGSRETPLDAAITPLQFDAKLINAILKTLLNYGADPTCANKATIKKFIDDNASQSKSKELQQAAQNLLQALFIYEENKTIGISSEHQPVSTQPADEEDKMIGIPEKHQAGIAQYLEPLSQLRKIDPNFDPINTPFPYGEKEDLDVYRKTPVELAAQNNHVACLTAMLAAKDAQGQPLVSMSTAYKAREVADNTDIKEQLTAFIGNEPHPKTTPSSPKLTTVSPAFKTIVKEHQQRAAHQMRGGKGATSQKMLQGIANRLESAIAKLSNKTRFATTIK